MSKQRATPRVAGSAIAEMVLQVSAHTTQGIGKLLLPKRSLLKRAFSPQSRNKEPSKTLAPAPLMPIALSEKKTDRFAIRAATMLIENISEEITRDHELLSKMRVSELVEFLAPARISIYKELWAQNEARISRPQRPSIGDLISQVYQHWRGEAPPRSFATFSFDTLLSGSLFALSFGIEKFCDAIYIA